MKRKTAVIILIAAAVCALPAYIFTRPRMSTDSKRSICDSDFIAFESCISMYRLVTGSFPTTEQGLNALVFRPADLNPRSRWLQVMDKIPNDPWGHPYRYDSDTTADPQKYSIISYGPDGMRSNDDRMFEFTVHKDAGQSSVVPLGPHGRDIHAP